MTDYKQRVAALSVPARELLCKQLGLQSVSNQLIAYYSSENPDDPPVEQAIDQHLKSQLPDRYHPAHYVGLAELPKLPNGKINYNALPPPELTSKRNKRASTYPATDTTQPDATDSKVTELISILESLLDFDGIEPGDNFFELGGDSITAIRFVSRAREAGINITVASLAKYHSLAEVVEHVESARPTADKNTISPFGEAPLTPIQDWFFHHQHPQPHHWCIAGRYEITEQISAEVMRNAVQHCISNHKELAASFHFNHHTWSCQYRDEAAPSVSSVAPDDSDDAVEKFIRDTARSFTLEQGWMIRFLITSDANGDAKELVWISHHLILDQLSVQTLVAEIEKLATVKSASTKSPEINSISAREWATRCEDTANSTIDSTASMDQNSDLPLATTQLTSEREAVETVQSIDQSTTTELLSLAKKHSVSLHNILLTALLASWRDCFERGTLALDIEGHGRDLLGNTIDNDSTIGWFSAFYPVNLHTDLIGNLTGTACRQVQLKMDEQKRSNQHFLLSAYHQTRKEKYGGNGRILFNHLGNIDNSNDSQLFKSRQLPHHNLRSPDNYRSHNIEINSSVTEDGLSILWSMAPAGVETDVLTQLTEQFRTHLINLTDERTAGRNSLEGELSPQAKPTPEDFPDIVMDQEDLDDFLDSLD